MYLRLEIRVVYDHFLASNFFFETNFMIIHICTSKIEITHLKLFFMLSFFITQQPFDFFVGR